MSSPLVIGIDFRPALSRATGVGRYFQGLVAGLMEVDRVNQYVLFSSSLKERPRSQSRPPNFQLVDRRVPVRVLNALWHRAELPSFDWLAGREVDVAHSPTPLILPSRRGRSMVTICDLFFLDRPEATPREIRRDYAALAGEHARRADAVLTISETTAREVRDRLGVSPEKIAVIHPGADPHFFRLSRKTNGSGPPYLLAVGTEEPRKNLPLLLEAIAALKRRGWEGRLKLAGGPGLDTPRIEGTISRLGLERDVDRLGYLDPDSLTALYRRARALVTPSRWEGFGLPLLEAMASELPIVASDIPVHREVAGDAAVFVPAEDGEAVAAGIERLWCDGELRARLVALGRERVKLYSWEASARKAAALYRRLGES